MITLTFRFIEEHFELMKPLVEVDPLFLQAVVYVCPKKELPGLTKQIPPFVSATWLSSDTVLGSSTLNTNEVCDYNASLVCFSDVAITFGIYSSVYSLR